MKYFLAIFAFDQLLKFVLCRVNFFGLSCVCNRGAAFGLGAEFNLFLIIFSNFLIIRLVYWVLSRLENAKVKVAGWFLLGAAASNLFDRIAGGCVWDYIDLRFWPVFNLADAVIVGMTVLIVYSLTVKR